MILADTSVWIAHFRRHFPEFASQLTAGTIATHSVVIGELATGNLHRRTLTLSLLRKLPRVIEATPDEALEFIETNRLHGLGLGWSDVLLLASARFNTIPLWTLDTRLCDAATRLGLHYATARPE